jgi:gamma-glutamyl:cysteine ligase YbdK (ATP-grasp superfamily)
MDLLRSWFAGSKFCDDELEVGLELEAWLIDTDGSPAPDNQLFLATLDRDWVVPELSKFNFELNVQPQYLSGSGLRDMQSDLNATWCRCRKVAERLKHQVVAVGILPTVTDAMLCLENMSSLKRYAALNRQVLQMRGGKPLRLEISGEDHLVSLHQDLMLESAATSIQVHLKVPERLAVRYYNASLIASAITVAMAANAPLLFGKRLWDDTRITLFEQAVDTAGPLPRVTFGDRYLKNSLLEIFEENLQRRVMLPVSIEQAPARMPYTRMHNGTVWNWNRPLIGFESHGQPHLRIEHRPMSASPTIADLFADTTLYLGLVLYLANLPQPPEHRLNFATTRANFYRAARDGMVSQITWLDGRQHVIADLLSEPLLDQALESLASNGVEESELKRTQEIVRGRLETRQNGATWQRRRFAKCGGDLTELLLSYVDHQASAQPVHLWS